MKKSQHWDTIIKKIDAVAPTCEEDGIIEHYECEVCDKLFVKDGETYEEVTTVVVAALGHTEVIDEAVAPTCTETGLTEGKHCSVCEEELVEQEEVDALGHDIEEHEAKAVTCEEVGWDAYETCTRCDYSTYEEIAALGHNYEKVSAVEATCEEEGNIEHYTCGNECGKLFVKDGETYEEVTDVAVDALGHDIEEHDAQAPTCTEKGWEAYKTCTRCDYSTYEEIAALGHDYKKVDAKAATCTEDGIIEHYECEVCEKLFVKDGETYIEVTDITVAATGHTEVIDDVVDPTCTEKGLTEGKHCSVCEEVLVAQEEVAALGHDKEEHDAQAPTCTEIGWEAYETCTRCDYTTYEAIAALGHDEVDHDAKEATCTEKGWEAYVTCTRCDYTTYEEITALGHDEVEHDAKAATCEEIGWEAYVTCTRCDYTTYEEIAASGHGIITMTKEEYIDIYTTQNSTSYPFEVNGNEIKSTNRRDSSSSSFIIEAKQDFTLELQYKVSSEDSYDKLIIKHNTITKVTASGTSITTYRDLLIDLKAGDKVTITYSKDGSDDKGSDCAWVKLITVAQEVTYGPELTILTPENVAQFVTCDDDLVCYKCGEIVVNKLEHDLINHDAKDPTCSEKGYYAHETCTRCDYTTIVEIEKLSHNIQSGVCIGCGVHESSEGLLFELNEDGESYKLVGIDNSNNCSFVVGIYNNKYVTKIDNSAFENCKTIRSIQLEECVTSIGINAFLGCTNLVEVINNSELNIVTKSTENGYAGYYAFEVHSGSSNLYVINDYVFYVLGETNYLLDYIGSDVDLELPDDFNGENYEIFGRAFANKTINSISIPAAVTKISDGAFNGTTLTILNIEDIAAWCNIEFVYDQETEDGVTDYWFNSNPINLATTLKVNGIETTDIVIPEGVTEISPFAFRGAKITSVSFPTTLTTIGIGSFRNSNIVDLVLPEGLQKIMRNAFENCSYLNSVSIPTTLSLVKENAFKNCTKLNAVYISDLSAWFNIGFSYDSDWDEGYWEACDANPLKYAHNLYLNNELIVDLVLPEDVTSLGSYCLQGGAFRSVTLHNQISSIPNGAFRDCQALDIHIPHNVKTVGDYAFNGCDATVLILTGVTSVGDWAFWSSSASTIYFGSTVPAEMSNEGNHWSKDKIRSGYRSVTIGGIDYSITGNEATVINVPKYHSGSFVIPDTIEYNDNSYTVKCINSYAFYKCNDIISVTLPAGLIHIEDYAFYDCKNLLEIINKSSLNIEYFKYSGILNNALEVHDGDSKLVKINDLLFYNLDGVNYLLRYYGNDTTLVLPENYNGEKYRIYNKAFENCTSLQNVTLNSNIEEIGSYAFSGCKSLVSIENLHGVTSIGEYAFSECSSLTSIELPNVVTSIGSFAFQGCNSLEEINIPNSVIYLGEYAFLGCKKLEKVVVGNLVPRILANTFKECTSLKDVKLGDSIIEIDNYAFMNCNSLIKITIPSSVTSIDDTAFEACYSLVEVCNKSSLDLSKKFINIKHIIDDEVDSAIVTTGEYVFFDKGNEVYLVKYIGNDTNIVLPQYNGGEAYKLNSYLFYKNSTITSITLDNSITEIGKFAFSNCVSLTSVTISNSVTSIGESVFYYCSSLTSITIPDSVTSIGDRAFYNCSSLTSITIPDSVTCIGNSTFANCISLKNIELPTSLTSIGSYAFADCRSLTSIEIPYGVKKIDFLAFESCYELTSIIIPCGVETMGQYVFEYCNKATIYCEEVSKPSNWSINWCKLSSSSYIPVVWGYNNITTNVNFDYVLNDNQAILTKYKGTATDVNIPSTISGYKVISFGKIFKGKNITSVSIPNTITEIENDAFSKCSSLETVTFVSTSKVSKVGNQAFYQCSSLKEINIPNSVKELGEGVFSYCNSLSNVVLGNGIKEIKSGLYSTSGLFNGCRALVNITLPTYLEVLGDYAFFNCSALTKITLPSTLNYLGKHAFNGCSSLGSIRLLSLITEINDYTFSGCTALYSVYMPNVTSIGNYAFANCTSLKNISLPSKLVSIGEKSFYGCSSLSSLTLPNTVETIGISAFDQCTSLETVSLSSSLVEIENGTFYGCSKLKEIIIPDSVTYVGANSFYGCSSLETIQLPTIGENHFGLLFGSSSYSYNADYVPESLKEVSITKQSVLVDYAFYECSNLTKITLNDSIVKIGEQAFYGCNNLEYNTYDNAKYLGSRSNPYLVLVKASSLTITGCNINANTRIIYYNAFSSCSKLESLVVPDNIVYIDGSAFSSCSSLQYNVYDNANYIGSNSNPYFIFVSINDKNVTSLEINSKTKYIMNNAFMQCASLESIVIPNSVIFAGENLFYGCSKLVVYCEHEVEPNEWHKDWNTSKKPVYFGYSENCFAKTDNAEYIIKDNEATLTKYFGKEDNLVVPSTIQINEVTYAVTSIGERAFYECNSLVNVEISEGITTIGSYAFYNCAELESVIFSKGLKSIGERAFYGCSSLINVNIPEGVTTIEASSFYMCGSLERVIIPDSVVTIGSYAFYSGENLTIYCESASAPSGWKSTWKSTSSTIYWGYDIESLQ